MALLGHVIGGAVFGLTARFWQLGILKRPMTSNLYGHLALVGAGGAGGWWWWNATVYMKGVLAEKEDQLRVRRKLQQRQAEVLLEGALADSPSEAQS
ncbi:hypothetical protein C8R43DRAFT_1120564 [Mycena crocata]|nr:hypothetical protein C8R43DRAFT_1120564 [Mycena crocata]